MGYVFGPAGEGELHSITAFLSETFGTPASAPWLDPDLMRWKYWDGVPANEPGRSYSLKSGGRILAHAAILPCRMRAGSMTIKVQHFIDWGASPDFLGAGVKLMRKLTALAEVTCAIGGSADTQRILPLLGFRPLNDAVTLARPVRPVRQALTHPSRNWKLPARFIRNTCWSQIPRLRKPADWRAVPAEPGEIPAELRGAFPEGNMLDRERSPDIIAHFLSCPTVKFRFFIASERGRPRGCFLLSFVPYQARIADLWLNEPSTTRYECLYRLATLTAIDQSDAAEVTVRASTAPRLEALGRCGFRVQYRQPIMAYPSPLPAGAELDCQFLDNDAPYLESQGTPYLT